MASTCSIAGLDSALKAERGSSHESNMSPKGKKRSKSKVNPHREAHRIAKILKEPKFQLVKRVVLLVGKEVTDQVLKETLRIERAGGLNTVDGKRRSRGGTFFTILKDYVPKTTYDKIYEEETRRKNQLKKKTRRLKRMNDKITSLCLDSDQQNISNPTPAPATKSPFNIPLHIQQHLEPAASEQSPFP